MPPASLMSGPLQVNALVHSSGDTIFAGISWFGVTWHNAKPTSGAADCSARSDFQAILTCSGDSTCYAILQYAKVGLSTANAGLRGVQRAEPLWPSAMGAGIGLSTYLTTGSNVGIPGR